MSSSNNTKNGVYFTENELPVCLSFTTGTDCYAWSPHLLRQPVYPKNFVDFLDFFFIEAGLLY